MQTLKLFSFLTLLMVLTTISFAQKEISETIPVSGNCGMCKSKIEKAAKTAGVEDAKWDMDAKTLTVKYHSSTTNAAKIQQAVAAVGYDTRDVKTTNEAYDKLHGCCKYDRSASVVEDCCKDGKCSKPGHDGKDCCKNADDKMPARTTQSDRPAHSGTDRDCCKDGKCNMPGHNGKDCCKATH